MTMSPHYFLLGIFALVGILSLAAAVFNWDWFFQAQSIPRFVRKAGRLRARLYYAAAGLVLIGMAAVFFHFVQESLG